MRYECIKWKGRNCGHDSTSTGSEYYLFSRESFPYASCALAGLYKRENVKRSEGERERNAGRDSERDLESIKRKFHKDTTNLSTLSIYIATPQSEKPFSLTCHHVTLIMITIPPLSLYMLTLCAESSLWEWQQQGCT